MTVKALIFMKWKSQRLPNKNVKEFCGKPLFYWIFKSLTESMYISEVVLNTDSAKIKNMVLEYFDVTVHKRSDHLIGIEENEANRIIESDLETIKGEHFIQTHSTNPLLTTETINKAIEKYFDIRSRHDSLFSVTPVKDRFYDSDGAGINHNPQHLEKTQDVEPIYKENSCIYVFNRKTFFKNRNRIGSNPYLFPTKRYESIDIDTLTDFKIAESIMQTRIVG